MKIIQRDNKKKKRLKDINAGQVFMFAEESWGDFYMKTANTNGGFIIVVNMDDGSVADFDILDEVICIDAELVVE